MKLRAGSVRTIAGKHLNLYLHDNDLGTVNFRIFIGVNYSIRWDAFLVCQAEQPWKQFFLLQVSSI